RDRRRAQRRVHACAAGHAIEPFVGEHDVVLADLGRQRAPPARALETADLEDVRVVCAELDLEWQPHLVFAEVRHANLLKALPLPEQRAAKDVNLPARRDEALAVVRSEERRVGEEWRWRR